ncbi:hypothetical protein Cni_G01823 [Canna indica]|uniref:Uncharacterized protein n=1 Tax=Canna indica TaxID=4628 RepID=A0AAQ3Q1G4_9LILI|nr:hypothetical protein Cni_G01823 [Canna indica]
MGGTTTNLETTARDYRVVLYDLVCVGSVNPDHFDFRLYTTLHAILAAIRRPELFLRLILIGASPWFLNDDDYHRGFELEDFDKVFVAMEANNEAWVQGFMPLAVGADVPTVVREFSWTLFNMRPDIVQHAAGHLDMAKEVSVPSSVAAYLKAHLGDCTAIEHIPVEGHLPHLNAPAALVHVLCRTLASPCWPTPASLMLDGPTTPTGSQIGACMVDDNQRIKFGLPACLSSLSIP